MIHTNFFFDESLLDCHIKKQIITVKEVELDEVDKEIINSSKRELTLLDKADLLKRIFDYPYRELASPISCPSYHSYPNYSLHQLHNHPSSIISTMPLSQPIKQPIIHNFTEEKPIASSYELSVADEKIINKTLNHSYLTLKNKVLKNRCFRQNLINLKRRTQQLLNNGGNDGNKMNEEQFQSKIDAAIRNETEKGRVRCPFCPRRCFLKENMRAHLASSHHGDRPYTCNQCDQRFATKEQLVSHHRIHLEAKPFRCQLCDKGFTQLGNLQRHHKIHERRAAAQAIMGGSEGGGGTAGGDPDSVGGGTKDGSGSVASTSSLSHQQQLNLQAQQKQQQHYMTSNSSFTSNPSSDGSSCSSDGSSASGSIA